MLKNVRFLKSGTKSYERVKKELGLKKDHVVLFDNSFQVLPTITQTREEDIKQALLEHIEKEAENGENVTTGDRLRSRLCR